MTQEQLDALLAEIGGSGLKYAPQLELKTIPNPARVDPDGTTNYQVPKEIQVQIQRWHDPTSGRVIEAYQGQNGWTITRNTTDKSLVNVGAPSPSTTQVPGNAVPRIEGTPDPSNPTGFNNDAPIMVWRTPPEPGYPNGRQVDAKPLTEAERTRWDQDQGRGPKNQPTTQQAAVPGYPGWVARATKDAQGNEITVYFSPNDPQTPLRSLPAKPEAPAQPQAGKPYKNAQGQWVQPIADANGNITGTRPVPAEAIPPEDTKSGEKAGAPYKNAQGQWVQPISDASGRVVRTEPLAPGAVPAEKPSEQASRYASTWIDKDTGEVMGITRGANPQVEVVPRAGQGQGAKPTGRAPSLPQFIVGASQDALRTAYDDIQAAVDRGERTPAWGENRRKEILETARLTVQEAQLHENSRQFNQGQAESLATTKLNYGQGALKFALQSALQINGKLKPGSSAGANMFRDLFLFQMQMARDSGIYGITPGGGQSSVGQGMPGAPTRAGNPQTRPPITAGDKEAHAASADARAANLAAGLEGNGAPREYTPAGSPGAVVPPPTTGAPPTPAALPGSPASAPNGSGDPGIYRPLPSSGPGDPGIYRPLPSSGPGDPGIYRDPSAAPAPSPVSSTPPPPLTNPAQAPGSGPTIRVADPWGNEFDMTQQQIDNRPANSPPLTRIGAPRAMTPPADTFPALEAFRMPLTPRPQLDPLAASNPADPMMSPAIQAARIAATPPWLLPPDQLENLVRQHGEDVVFGYPGMPQTGAV